MNSCYFKSYFWAEEYALKHGGRITWDFTEWCVRGGEMTSGFHCSSETFKRAQRNANLTGLTHYIGNTPAGAEVIGTDPESLHQLGCPDVVPVPPERDIA